MTTHEDVDRWRCMLNELSEFQHALTQLGHMVSLTTPSQLLKGTVVMRVPSGYRHAITDVLEKIVVPGIGIMVYEPVSLNDGSQTTTLSWGTPPGPREPPRPLNHKEVG